MSEINSPIVDTASVDGKKKRFKRYQPSKTNKAIAAVLLLFGVLSAVHEIVFVNVAKATEAIVVDKRYHSRYTSAVYSFVLDGKVYTGDSKEDIRDYPIGTIMSVLYDPKDPKESEKAEHWMRWFAPFFLLFSGGIGLYHNRKIKFLRDG